MRRDETVRQIKVGAFVAAGLGLLFAMLFVLGRTQGLFVRRIALGTSFRNTAGLAVGAAVRLGGVDVGTVQAIRFSSDPRIKDVAVDLRVDGRYLDRVRADSVARLVPKGLLGDMTVDISVGSADQAGLPEGATVASAENQGLGEVIAAIHEGIAEVAALSRGLRAHVDEVLTPEVASDVGRVVHATANVAEAIDKGKGLAHALLHDESLTRDAAAGVRGLELSAVHLSRALDGIDRLVAEVESGNGSLHALIRGDDVPALLADARRATADLADAAAQLRAGHGTAHGLIYGAEGDDLVKNLAQLARILRGLGQDVAQGKGTVGALLQDPTIYDDMKIILRDIKRNQLLKALVRFTIKHDGLGVGSDGSPTR